MPLSNLFKRGIRWDSKKGNSAETSIPPAQNLEKADNLTSDGELPKLCNDYQGEDVSTKDESNYVTSNNSENVILTEGIIFIEGTDGKDDEVNGESSKIANREQDANQKEVTLLPSDVCAALDTSQSVDETEIVNDTVKTCHVNGREEFSVNNELDESGSSGGNLSLHQGASNELLYPEVTKQPEIERDKFENIGSLVTSDETMIDKDLMEEMGMHKQTTLAEEIVAESFAVAKEEIKIIAKDIDTYYENTEPKEIFTVVESRTDEQNNCVSSSEILESVDSRIQECVGNEDSTNVANSQQIAYDTSITSEDHSEKSNNKRIPELSHCSTSNQNDAEEPIENSVPTEEDERPNHSLTKENEEFELKDELSSNQSTDYKISIDPLPERNLEEIIPAIPANTEENEVTEELMNFDIEVPIPEPNEPSEQSMEGNFCSENENEPEKVANSDGNSPQSLKKVESNSAFTDAEDLCDDSLALSCSNTDPGKWKVGYLQVKLPSKARKTKLKAWQKRWIVIQADEFTSDKKNCSLMLSIYQSESGNSRSHSSMFWKSVCSKSAMVYRSLSKRQPFAFTVTDNNEALVHLAAESETAAQEWISAIRAILWPPSSVLQLEKVLNGNEFEISLIDDDFSHRAGLLGTFGYMTVTSRKLILCHPQSGHVIQEWYLNTVEKFRIQPHSKEEDANRILLMHTSSDSSTGAGVLKIFCLEAVDLLKSVALTIHKVLQYHAKGNSAHYKKELAEIAHWLTPQPSPTSARNAGSEDYYKVPPRQVRSLLDIPNFIFDMPTKTVMVSDALPDAPVVALETEHYQQPAKLKNSTTCVSNSSQDSGISLGMPTEEVNNNGSTSFTIGNRNIRLHLNDRTSSESSDCYSPSNSPVLERREFDSATADDVKNVG